MRKWLVHGIVVVILANVLPGNLLMLIGQLAYLHNHYHDHQATTDNHGLYHFIVDHYFGEHHESDHQHHEKLPFHQHHDQPGPLSQAPFMLPSANYMAFVSGAVMVVSELPDRDAFGFKTSYFADIWQPPKAPFRIAA